MADTTADISQVQPAEPGPGMPFYQHAGELTLEASVSDSLTEPASQAPTVSEAKQSATAYEGSTPGMSSQVLEDTFGSQLRASSYGIGNGHGTFQRFQDSRHALFLVHGQPEIMSSTLPLATRKGRRLTPVALGLTSTGSGFSPSNPLVGTQLPAAGAGSAELSDLGIGIRALVDNVSGTQLSGQDRSVFYADVANDTDMVQSATARGIEIFTQLRSENSPLLQRYQLTLPAGVTAKALDGGVAILRDGRTVANIQAPQATDAAGQNVPASLALNGNEVDVREQPTDTTEYPVLVDPTIQDVDYGSVNDTPGWFTQSNQPTLGGQYYAFRNDCYQPVSCETDVEGNTMGYGLYVYAYGGETYNAGVFGEWSYNPNLGTGYITQLNINGWSSNRHGDTGQDPYSYYGLWSSADDNWDGIQSWATEDVTNIGIQLNPNPGDNTARSVDIGMFAPNTITLPAWHDLAVATIVTTYAVPVTAPGTPQATAVDGAAAVAWSAPSDNGGNAVTSYTIQSYNAATGQAGPSATASGTTGTVTGLTNGVAYYFSVSATNAAGTGPTSNVSNTVTPAAPSASVSCDGNGAWNSTGSENCTITGSDPDGLASLQYETSPDDVSWSAPTSVSSGTAVSVSTEGRTYVRALATDAGANTVTSSPDGLVQIDRSEPTESVSGPLADSPYSSLPNGSYSLTVDADDATTADDGTTPNAISGVRSISIAVDGTAVTGSPFSNPNCTATSCSTHWEMSSWSYTPTTGSHTITITATDLAGNSSSYDFDVDGPWQSSPQPTNNLNLSLATALRIDGAAGGDLSGAAVTDIGDINNDGIEDYAIGAPDYNNGAGAVFVIYGRCDQTTSSPCRPATMNLTSLSETPSTDGFRIDGQNGKNVFSGFPGDMAGTALAAAGDVNGDGYDDFLIGVPRATPGGAETQTGAVYVIYGGPSLTGFNLANITTSGPGGAAAGFVINGPSGQFGALTATYKEPFGTSLAGAAAGATSVTGDVNGDGLDDVIVAEPDLGNGSSFGAGNAWVIFGQTGGAPVNVSSLQSTQGFEILGGGSNAGLGTSVAMYGDQNGDGLVDIALAAPGVNCGSATSNGGAIYVLYGKSSSTQINLANSLPTAQGYEICGATGDRLGSTTSGHGLADVGDVNTDGIDDLAVGGDGGYVIFGTKASTPVDLSTINSQGSYIGYRLAPPGSGYTSSSEVFALGDVNNDDEPDMAITDPTATSNTGDAYVVYGKPSSSQVNLANISAAGASSGGELGFHAAGSSTSGKFGSSVIGLMNAAGDGDSDVLIGAPGATQGGTAAGSTYLIPVPNTANTEAASTASGCGGTNPVPCQPLNPTGHGLAFQYTCGYSLAEQVCKQTAEPTYQSADPNVDGPADELASAQSMHVFRLLVPWDAATPANCHSTDPSSYPNGFQDPNADCDALHIADFLKMVKSVEQHDHLGIAIEISLTNTKNVNYGATSNEAIYQAALGYLVTYVNQTLGAPLGMHVRFWSSWNEPDYATHDPKVANPAIVTANYLRWAHEELEIHYASGQHGVAPDISSTASTKGGSGACTTDGACVVIAGEFADFTRSYTSNSSTSDAKYIQQVRTFRHTYDYTPAVWSYHGYDDITSTSSDGSSSAYMADGLAMIDTFQHDTDWKVNGHVPPVWMTEGADALANGPSRSADNSAAPSTTATCSTDPAPDLQGVHAAVDRFLALTTGNAGTSGWPVFQTRMAKKIAVALYYEVGAGGSGSAPNACGYAQNLSFDSSLFESTNEAQQTNHTAVDPLDGNTTEILVRPRPAYCYLTGQTPSNCNGVNVPDA